MANRRERVFGIIEVVIMLVVVILAVAVIFYYLKTNQTNNNRTTDVEQTAQSGTKSNTATPSPSSQASNQKYLVVKEWGVKFPYVSSDTLVYKYYAATANQGSYISVTSEALMAASQVCASNYEGGGAIVRGAASESFVVGTGNVDTFQDYYNKHGDLMGKVGSYYYGFNSDNGQCADNLQNVAQNVDDLVQPIVAKVQAE